MENICKFVVLSHQRSGSTFFRLYLNSHPQIRCHGEIFLKTYGAKDGFRNWCQTTSFWTRMVYILRIYKPLLNQFFHQLFNDEAFCAPWTNIKTWNEYQPRAKMEREKAVGFKLMYSHMESTSLRYKKLSLPLKKIIKQVKCTPSLTQYVKENGFRIIHLIRENPLKIEVSRLAAEKRMTWHTTEKIKQCMIFVDPTTIKRNIKNILDNHDKYRKAFSNNPCLEITYERFVANRNETTNRILRFLEVDNATSGLEAPLKKISPDILEDIISNYDEIKEVLTNTSFERYLYYP